MNGEVIQTATGTYVRCARLSEQVSKNQDVLDLLAYCGEAESNKILLDEEHLHPDFFDLKTGLARAIFQKFSTYHVKAAIIIDLDGIRNERFQELIYECNKGNQINFFHDISEAEEWLIS